MATLSTHLWFDKEARDAADFYKSVFKGSKITSVTTLEDTPSGSVDVVNMVILGHPFILISAGTTEGSEFKFTAAISFVINCSTQKEIDYYWEKLSADPDFEQCGWLKDKYGVAWQVVPKILDKMMLDKDKSKVARVTQAFLKMKKFDIAELKTAFKG